MQKTPCPDNVIYEPSSRLESTSGIWRAAESLHGELPIQVGFCGYNKKLNAVEYHRSSELDIAASDAILLLGWQPDVTEDYTYETAKIEAFLLPKGVGVELYATTLHYAPCSAGNAGFRVVIVLPRDTNLPLDAAHEGGEDGHLTAKNKWLIGHRKEGFRRFSLGLIGENITLD